jgi:ubiquinone/menaquinone biosynthesis C-methylase UbiE
MATPAGGPASPTSPTDVVASPMAPDSQASDDDDSDLQSLTESVTDYPVEWGRTYHRYKEGSYLYPNDSEELDRMNLHHDCAKKIRGNRLFLAPLKSPERILDIGTGTGIWPIEVAELFPKARIIGTDLSAVQPSHVPPNVFFQIADCTDDHWGFKPSSFDLIHTDFLLGSLPSFYDLITKSKRYLKRGTGWLECHDLDIRPYCDDGTMPDDWPMSQYARYMLEGSQCVDPPRSVDTAKSLAAWMRQAGFVDVKERVDKMPINPWPKDPALKQLGRNWNLHLLSGLAGWSYKTFGDCGLGWTRERIEIFLVDVRKSAKDRYVHAYVNLYVVYGRRPTAEEEEAQNNAPPEGGGQGRSS